MFQLYVLNKMGQQVYIATLNDLGEAITIGKDVLKHRENSEYAYIIETVTQSRENSAFFTVHHRWFAKKELNDDPT